MRVSVSPAPEVFADLGSQLSLVIAIETIAAELSLTHTHSLLSPVPTAYSPSQGTSPNETVGKPPPVPVKRSRTFRQSSSSEAPNTLISTTPRSVDESHSGTILHCSLIPSPYVIIILHSCPRGEPYLTEARVGEKPRPTPHPRSNTLERRSINGKCVCCIPYHCGCHNGSS